MVRIRRAVASRSRSLPLAERRLVLMTLLGALAGASLLWSQRGGPRYEVRYTTQAPSALVSDGDEAFRRAASIDWGHPNFRTRFWALWSDQGLGLRFVARDPSPWFTMVDRDDPIWNEEVVEIFLDLDHTGTHYAEYELNPNNTLCDLQMLRGVPDIEGNIEWDHLGARHAVWPYEENGKTTGWEARLFLPWTGFASLPSAAARSFPPKPGESFRFNVFRIERPHGARRSGEGVLFMPYLPTGQASFHVPEVFHEFVFIE